MPWCAIHVIFPPSSSAQAVEPTGDFTSREAFASLLCCTEKCDPTLRWALAVEASTVGLLSEFPCELLCEPSLDCIESLDAWAPGLESPPCISRANNFCAVAADASAPSESSAVAAAPAPEAPAPAGPQLRHLPATVPAAAAAEATFAAAASAAGIWAVSDFAALTLPPAAAVVCAAADAACASDCETIANAIATESDPDSSSCVADFSCGGDCVVFADPSVAAGCRRGLRQQLHEADARSACATGRPAAPVASPAAVDASVAFAAEEPAAAPAVAGMPRRLVAVLETDLSATGVQSKRCRAL